MEERTNRSSNFDLTLEPSFSPFTLIFLHFTFQFFFGSQYTIQLFRVESFVLHENLKGGFQNKSQKSKFLIYKNTVIYLNFNPKYYCINKDR